jgi:hypothetical protein
MPTWPQPDPNFLGVSGFGNILKIGSATLQREVFKFSLAKSCMVSVPVKFNIRNHDIVKKVQAF